MDRQLVALLLLGVGLLVGAAAVAPVAAEHGSKSDFTVTPHDRAPGLTDATYEQHAVSPITFSRLDSIRATYREGGFSGCGMSNSKVFGIDRNDDDPGTRTDHELNQHVETFEVKKHTFYVEFYDEDDFGSSTNLDAGDEFVSLTEDCFDNPPEPGWYQIESTITGTAPNGSEMTAHDVSHYFYVCRCSSEAAAREQFGPPPSEPEPTATPTPTAEPTPTRTPPEEGTPFLTPTPTATVATTATPTDAPEEDHAAQVDPSGSGPTATATPADWDSYARQTPTVGSGPGFGAVGALVALAVAGLVGLRRRG